MGNSLAVQCLGLNIFHSCVFGFHPGQGPRVPQAMKHSQKINLKNFVKNEWHIKNGTEDKDRPIQYFLIRTTC